jgi:hypothetical protein
VTIKSPKLLRREAGVGEKRLSARLALARALLGAIGLHGNGRPHSFQKGQLAKSRAKKYSLLAALMTRFISATFD